MGKRWKATPANVLFIYSQNRFTRESQTGFSRNWKSADRWIETESIDRNNKRFGRRCTNDRSVGMYLASLKKRRGDKACKLDLELITGTSKLTVRWVKVTEYRCNL